MGGDEIIITTAPIVNEVQRREAMTKLERKSTYTSSFTRDKNEHCHDQHRNLIISFHYARKSVMGASGCHKLQLPRAILHHSLPYHQDFA